jgi:nitroreductase
MTIADGWPAAGWASAAAGVDDAALPPVLHPLLAARWSPTTFDPSYEVTTADVDAILEAARWAPSAGNSQPWAFITGRRADPVHARLTRHLTGSSAAWAPSASLLVANLCHRCVEGTDWEYSEFAHYDLGQAVAHMTFQAQALGLHARQFRAFNRTVLAAEFTVPQHWEITTMSAFGRLPPGLANIPEPAANEPRPPRHRRSPREIRWVAGGGTGRD